jgi:hypothetical protein
LWLRDGDSDFLIGVNLNRYGNLQMLGNPQQQYLKAGKWKNIDVIERFNEAEVLDAFSGKTKQGSLEHFYCHAAVDGNSQASFKSRMRQTPTTDRAARHAVRGAGSANHRRLRPIMTSFARLAWARTTTTRRPSQHAPCGSNSAALSMSISIALRLRFLIFAALDIAQRPCCQGCATIV